MSDDWSDAKEAIGCLLWILVFVAVAFVVRNWDWLMSLGHS